MSNNNDNDENEIVIEVETFRDLSSGNNLSEDSLDDLNVISIDEEFILISMPTACCQQGQRVQIELLIVYEGYKKINFITQGQVAEMDIDDTDETRALVSIKMKMFNNATWQEIRDLYKERQEKTANLFQKLRYGE